LYRGALFEGLFISHFELNFGKVIVGQSVIVATQFQNLQKIPIEFSFGEPQFVTKQVSDPQLPSALVFSPSPVNGVVQPACFQNIDITFTPESEDAFEVQIPYSITYKDP
jgi:hypothetical protein